MRRHYAVVDDLIEAKPEKSMKTKHLTPALSPLPLQGNAEREKRSQRLDESHCPL
jgi:hypothetical protein